MLVGRIVPVAPDPLALARGLVARGHRHVALLHAADPEGPAWARASFLAADPVGESDALDPFGEEGAGIGGERASGRERAGTERVGEAWLARAPRWIGVIPFEARRGLEREGWRPVETRAAPMIARPRWFRYAAVAWFDRGAGRVLVVGESVAAAEGFARALVRAEGASISGDPRARAGRAARVEVEDEEPPARHAERIARARELILAGDLYQVNLARRLRVVLREGSALALHERLAGAAHAPLSAYLELGDVTVMSTSPELLLAAEAAPGGGFGELATEPIKGTRPRGAHAAADLALARELDADPKERAELAMIVDVERNDLGRVAQVGSVRIAAAPRVVTHRTIHHRVALVTARARPGLSREEVLRAIVPSGSVTGAPKVRAMEVIASLEARRRGLYTGGLGFVRHDGGVVLAMAIRTVVLGAADGEGEYWTGGGIVADSDPAREVEETRWKALQLMRAAGST